MSSPAFDLHSWCIILTFSCLLVQSLGVNTDGYLLLSLKFSVLSDPLGVLDSWNYHDQTPCSWKGVTCGTPYMVNSSFRVIGLSLPNSQLLGSIPGNLGFIQHLRNLNLSNNSINGSIPLSLFTAPELQMLDLSDNLISGELSDLVGGLSSLELLNLSNNALVGKIPENLTTLHNLTVLSLKSNYFSGSLPSELNSVEILDLSSNLINGSLPSNFSGDNLRYFNASYNRLSGEITSEFAKPNPHKRDNRSLLQQFHRRDTGNEPFPQPGSGIILRKSRIVRKAPEKSLPNSVHHLNSGKRLCSDLSAGNRSYSENHRIDSGDHFTGKANRVEPKRAQTQNP
ncbi:leucine-rich repeat protein kinase family protein [Actinidia rufa]|uniref:Leucine-rich repeat protein kinase family protein n=1 Tax=Actinidia rufa TaxID=165716 RepID=A0A7J0H6N8_9ERIC|nr:leucine-rich repeat protein kinase family protein [Actinidia rufa]